MKELIEKLELIKSASNSDYVKNTLTEAIQALQQREGDTETYDIDFNGHVMCRIEITNNKPKIIGAMNGYGNAIDLDKISITPPNK
jgi:hypothetical protein